MESLKRQRYMSRRPVPVRGADGQLRLRAAGDGPAADAAALPVPAPAAAPALSLPTTAPGKT